MRNWRRQFEKRDEALARAATSGLESSRPGRRGRNSASLATEEHLAMREAILAKKGSMHPALRPESLDLQPETKKVAEEPQTETVEKHEVTKESFPWIPSHVSIPLYLLEMGEECIREYTRLYEPAPQPDRGFVHVYPEGWGKYDYTKYSRISEYEDHDFEQTVISFEQVFDRGPSRAQLREEYIEIKNHAYRRSCRFSSRRRLGRRRSVEDFRERDAEALRNKAARFRRGTPSPRKPAYKDKFLIREGKEPFLRGVNLRSYR